MLFYLTCLILCLFVCCLLWFDCGCDLIVCLWRCGFICRGFVGCYLGLVGGLLFGFVVGYGSWAVGFCGVFWVVLDGFCTFAFVVCCTCVLRLDELVCRLVAALRALGCFWLRLCTFGFAGYWISA